MIADECPSPFLAPNTSSEASPSPSVIRKETGDIAIEMDALPTSPMTYDGMDADEVQRGLARRRKAVLTQEFFSSDVKQFLCALISVKDPELSTKIIRSMKSEEFRNACEFFLRLPPAKRRELLYEDYDHLIPKEYHFTTVDKLQRTEWVAGFIESSNELLHNQNVHYLMHVLVNVFIYSMIGILNISEMAFINSLVLDGARITILENNMPLVCGLTSHGASFSIRGPLYGGLLSRLDLTIIGLVSSIGIGSAISLVPALLRPIIMPIPVIIWLLCAEKYLNNKRENEERHREAISLRKLDLLVEQTGLDEEELQSILRDLDVQAFLNSISYNSSSALKYAAVDASVDEEQRKFLRDWVASLVRFNRYEKESEYLKSNKFKKYLRIETSKKKKPWTTNIYTSGYQLCKNRESRYCLNLTGIGLAIFINGSLIMIVNALSPYIAVTGETMGVIAPPGDLNQTCLELNATDMLNQTTPLTGYVEDVNPSPTGNITVFALALGIDVLLPAASGFIQVVTIATWNGGKAAIHCITSPFKRCFRRRARYSEDD
ncbi:hypothetical protein [Spongorhabdus nitratireducens]